MNPLSQGERGRGEGFEGLSLTRRNPGTRASPKSPYPLTPAPLPRGEGGLGHLERLPRLRRHETVGCDPPGLQRRGEAPGRVVDRLEGELEGAPVNAERHRRPEPLE